MPELSVLPNAGLNPQAFRPLPTNSYFDRTPVPPPIVDTRGASKASGKAALWGSIAKVLSELPEKLIASYQKGRQLKTAGIVSNKFNQAIASGDPRALSDFSATGEGALSYKPGNDALEAAKINYYNRMGSPGTDPLKIQQLQNLKDTGELRRLMIEGKRSALDFAGKIPLDDEAIAPNSAVPESAPGTPDAEATLPADMNGVDFTTPLFPTQSNAEPASSQVAPEMRQQIEQAAAQTGGQLASLNPAMNAMEEQGLQPLANFSAEVGGMPSPAQLNGIPSKQEPFTMDMAGANTPTLPEQPAITIPEPAAKAISATEEHPISAVKDNLKQGLRRQSDGTITYYKDGLVTHFGIVGPDGRVQLKPYQYPTNSVEGKLVKKGYNPKVMNRESVDAALKSIQDPLRPDTVKDLTARRIPTYNSVTGTEISNSDALAKLQSDDISSGRNSLTDAKNIFDVKKTFGSSDQYKNAFRQASSYNNFTASFEASQKTQNGMADVGLLDAFIKTQNPGGVIRQSTAAMVLKAQGLLEKYTPEFVMGKLKNGTFLTPADRENMKKVMDLEVEHQRDYFNKSLLAPYRDSVKELGGKPESLIGPYDYFGEKEAKTDKKAGLVPPSEVFKTGQDILAKYNSGGYDSSPADKARAELLLRRAGLLP